MNININELPKEITMDLVLESTDWGWLRVYEAKDTCTGGDTMISISSETVTVTFKTKGKTEITAGLVENLKAESKKIRANAEASCKEIDEKINSLLALTCD